MPQDNSLEARGFVPSGVLTVTPAAIALAKAFAENMPRFSSGAWTVSFFWATAQSVTRHGVTRDLGPGLGLGAHQSDLIPEAAIIEQDGFRYTLQIPREVVAQAARKIIDTDPAVSPTAVRLL